MPVTARQTRRHGAWARMTRSWLVAMLLGILALATQIAPVAANLPLVTVAPGPVLLCSEYQCITDVKVTPHGQFANIAFQTSFAKIATVQVSTVAPKKLADGSLSYENLPVDSFSITPTGAQHAVEASDLQPGTAYHYLISAVRGTTGKDAQYQGTFTTLQRYIKTTISEIDVIDDSDDLSAGDLVFNLVVNGAGPAIFPSAETTQWDSGEAKIVDMQVKTTSDDQATVTLKGWDWDADQQGWLIGSPITIGSYETAGIGGDGADVTTTFNVAGNGHDQAFTQNFSLVTTSESLKWRAFGSIQVFYAP
jgi:hypothetical protein